MASGMLLGQVGACQEKVGVAMDGMRVFDLHCDTLDRLCLHDYPAYPGFARQNASEGIPLDRLQSLKDNDGHISLDRMGDHPWCQCFAIFVPDKLMPDDSWELFTHVNNFFTRQMQEHSSLVEQVRDGRNIQTVLASGKKVALLTVEGAPFFWGPETLWRVDELAQAGVMMVTLTWNGPNAIASGIETQSGIKPFGRDVIAALEGKHIIIDASHLNDQSFTDLLTCAQRPFAASHSNARSVCGHPRNLQDWQFKEIAQRGGIVGLNFYNDFLIDDKRDATPDEVLLHIEHWLELDGQDALALGSDYDGSDVPTWLHGCEKMEVLYALVGDRFGGEIANKLFFENAQRFFSEYARS